MIRRATLTDVDHVAAHMCAQHAYNVRSISFTDDVHGPLYAVKALDAGFAICRDDVAHVLAGAMVTHPGHASTFMWGVEGWERCVVETTRFFKKRLVPALRQQGVHRLTVFAPAQDDTGERWKRLMGCELEATLRKYDKHGRDWNLFVRFL